MAIFSQSCKTSALLGISSSVLAIAILVKWVLLPIVIEKQIKTNLELIEGTQGYETWVEPNNEIYTKYYFYHVENPDAIKNGSKPKVIEIGPYVYKEVRKKLNIVPLGDDTLAYGQWISYTFDPDQTRKDNCFNPLTNDYCKARDNVTVINSALVGMIDLILGLPNLPSPIEGSTIQDAIFLLLQTYLLAETAVFPDDLFHTFPVDDILWQGHSPGIIKMIFSIIDLIKSVIKLDLNEYLPPQLANGTLAFFRGSNGTDTDNFFKINRGRSDMSKYCQIEELNGKSELPAWWWPDLPWSPSAQKSGVHDTCHTLQGSDGVYFPPLLDKNYPLWLYVADLCRSVFADFESETEIKGISAWRFRANLNLINYTHPENLCFCPQFRKCAKPDASGQAWDLSGCEEPCLDGLLYASGCRGVPIILSAPHFYNADPVLEASVDGLKSDINKHDTYLDVEPLTGVTLSAYKRGQINVHLKPVQILSGFAKVPKVIFPVFWAEETATLDDENALLFKSMVTTPLLLVDIFVYTVGFAFSPVGIIVAIFFKVKLRYDDRGAKVMQD